MDREEVAERIVHHAALYRLTISKVVERLFFDEAYPDEDLRTKKVRDTLAYLVRNGLLEAKEFPSKKKKGRSTKKEKRVYYCTPGTKLEPSAVDRDLAVLWWCHITGPQMRYRLTHDELLTLVDRGKKPPHHHVRHCLETTPRGRCCIYRMYPTTATKPLLLDRLRKKHLPATRSTHPGMIWSGDLGVSVLVDDKDKKHYLERQLKRVPKKGGESLISQTRITVAVVPTSETIEEWLKPA